MKAVPPSKTIARFGHWALLFVVVLMGFALVVTVWGTNRGVDDASETMIRGQADVLRAAVRSRITRAQPTPTAEQLDELFEEHGDDGLRYIGVFEQDGSLVIQHGEPSGGDVAATARGARAVTQVERVGGRVRVFVRGVRARRNRRQPVAAARPPTIVIEFEPRAANELDEHAERSLLIGAISAGVLVFISIVLVRWYMRREQLERQLEQERRLASLGQMSAVLAHEIRNPIASLKGNAQLLARMVPEENEKARRKAGLVVDESVRLETLTNDLLEFARAGVLERTDVDPTALARDVAEQHDVDRIRVDDASAPSRWSLDADRMRQVLGNLFENALQAGEGDLPIEVRVATEGGRLVYTVRDRGSGIDPADVEHIFEPFYTRKTRGTGLGLAVCKRLVELHGGTISASNAPDGGAIFRAAIPR